MAKQPIIKFVKSNKITLEHEQQATKKRWRESGIIWIPRRGGTRPNHLRLKDIKPPYILDYERGIKCDAHFGTVVQLQGKGCKSWISRSCNIREV